MIFYNGFNLLVDIALVTISVLVTHHLTVKVILKEYHKSPF